MKQTYMNYTSLFRGREDVFARRWETKDKSGYAPAKDIDWNQYSLHKASGGTLKDYPYKSYSKLTETAIIAHLDGREETTGFPRRTPRYVSWDNLKIESELIRTIE